MSRDDTRVASAAWALAPVPPSSRHPPQQAGEAPGTELDVHGRSLPLLPTVSAT